MNQVFIHELTQLRDAYGAAAMDLRADSREDEAVFARIRQNVCEIFLSVADAAEKHAADPDEFFLQKLLQIPAAWKTAGEKAGIHGNSEQAYLEQLKLETAAQIRSLYAQHREDAP